MLWRVVTKKTYPVRIIAWFVATEQTFVATKIILVAAPANDKHALVATKHACMLVATKRLSRPTRVFRDKYLFCWNRHTHTFTATKDVFCRDNDSFCSEQTAIQQTTCSTVKWLLYNHLAVLQQQTNKAWTKADRQRSKHRKGYKERWQRQTSQTFFRCKPPFFKVTDWQVNAVLINENENCLLMLKMKIVYLCWKWKLSTYAENEDCLFMLKMKIVYLCWNWKLSAYAENENCLLMLKMKIVYLCWKWKLSNYAVSVVRVALLEHFQTASISNRPFYSENPFRPT